MIIYIEKSAYGHNLTKTILDKHKWAEVVLISNYKNIFDKKIYFPTEKSIVIAEIKSDIIWAVPDNYSPVEKSFFFKTSLNCIFDCKYCYLKWAFKNDFLTIFVNYDDIKKAIKTKIKEIRDTWYTDTILFYASDYSDNLWLENLTSFHKEFIPFFEQADNVIMETRTKSSNIAPLLKLWFVPRNTEIAFSLNPEHIVDTYEIWSSSLKSRISSINTLLDNWFKVWLRFLPLLPIENYLHVYSKFLDRIINEIDLHRISSISVGSLLYTKDDYNKILKKEPETDFLYRLEDVDNTYVRADLEFRTSMYKLFKEKIGNFNITLDTSWEIS